MSTQGTQPRSRVPVADYFVLEEEPHLIASRCIGCGEMFLQRQSRCAACGGSAFERRRLTGSGTIRTFTVVHRAPAGVNVPFVAAVVDLDDGPSIRANLVGAMPDHKDIPGARVDLITFPCGHDSQGTEAVAFGFALQGSPSGVHST